MELKPIAVLLVLLAVTGCVQVTHPPTGGVSDQVKDAYAKDWIDQVWSGSAISDRQPPDLTPTFVKQEDWGPAIVDCMTAAGYTGYTAIGGGGYSWTTFDPATDLDQEYVRLVCMSLWQGDPEIRSAAELGYLYDFYRDSTVPCLELAGLTVADAPSRAEFIESNGAWSPTLFAQGDDLSYFGIDKSPWYRSTEGKDLTKRCTLWPPGWESGTPQG